METVPARFVSEHDVRSNVPVHVVWELTLACNLKCQHCGSRAGRRRQDELSTDEALALVADLAALGTREVTLIGGEAFMRRDWLQIIRAIRDHGMSPSLQSGGYRLTEEKVKAAADAGLVAAGVSIDGPPELHDRLRGVKGSFDWAMRALAAMRDNGLVASVNTQITRDVMPHLREIQERLMDVRVRNWQVQLTVAMGRAADHPEFLLQPYELLELMPLLAELYHAGEPRGLLLQAGNNVGYFGPYEHLFRGYGNEQAHYTGCQAGTTGIGIEADGTIKGCPSLPTTPYAGGNIRDTPLSQMWRESDALTFARDRTADDLWGFCRGCYYAEICRGGCNWTSHSLFGKPGNNPFCHHRALELDAHGLRERIVQVAAAPGCSFDHGEFELILEPADGAAETVNVMELARRWNGSYSADAVPAAPSYPPAHAGARPSRLRATPPMLVMCHACSRMVGPDEAWCPFCQASLKESEELHVVRMERARQASQRILELIGA
ncbi:GDL motif peptide-associated radical SAM/SPASM maturase [Longimicrobium terrae]|uniref:Y-X(10)_GDL-associated radical SAM protein n=1 Tax=Longimicrobium terrae TaxID=1639882 RepID=A0A841GXV9_9BACT|nr:GDL motif peptide-associated radical SAM/SPASM maturase [Longimicrobium terrae]MBB4636188.1 Y-X(10)_GDL-associated radical SAM protein [Longimicrobium terrae]MBB6070583.1 Y-X(10)_GDL-associated radical SAM protein [Longimicrobium terrae]NNC29568.1 GDL motif peptide-associated radical SAM/SPASM maturase [Longimicrobium terrae]